MLLPVLTDLYKHRNDTYIKVILLLLNIQHNISIGLIFYEYISKLAYNYL